MEFGFGWQMKCYDFISFPLLFNLFYQFFASSLHLGAFSATNFYFSFFFVFGFLKKCWFFI